LRRLTTFRSAVDNAQLHGDDLSGLIQPPSYEEIDKALAWIADAMIQSSKRNGLVSGFIQEIAQYAAIGDVVSGDFEGHAS